MKKKIIGLAALSLAVLSINAQTPGTATTTADKPVSIQIRAGVNFQNLTGESGGNDYENDLKTGFHAGVEVPIMIAPDFYIQPGVLYSLKGAKSKDNSDLKTNLSYVEVPVNFVYKPLLGSGHLILGVGPYLGIAIGGTVTNGDDDVDIEFEKEVTLAQYATAPYYKRTDFGGNFLVGYELSNKLFFQLNAQLGLTNIAPKIEGFDEDDYNIKNTGFGLSVGYRF
ncbi:MAG: PorT family protein [Chitinophagaceae bacterium]|nr:PorT family protein [Chitinophagaceae bacterium]